MRKIVIALLVLLLVCNVMTSYADSNVEGLWVGNGGSMISILKIEKNNKCTWIIIMNMNGKCSSGIMEGTWKLNGKNLTVKTEKGSIDMGKGKDGSNLSLAIDAQTTEYTLSGDKLQVKGSKNYFVKVPEIQ